MRSRKGPVALKGMMVAAVAGLLMLVPATTAIAHTDDADVSVTLRLPAHKPIKAKLGEIITLPFSVTNHGPSRSRGVVLAFAIGDAFNPVSLRCGDLREADSGITHCPNLAPGQTVRGVGRVVVCCFPVGEPRKQQFVGVGILESLTTDPNTENNFAYTTIRLIGRHGFAP
jgi:hypothetical protein